MALEALKKTEWRKLSAYGQFERVALVAVLLMLGLVVVYATVVAAIKLFGDLALGELFLDKAALQDSFGSILTIVILLEFNHSIYVALTERSGAIQTRAVVLIAVLVIARKLMLKDLDTLDRETLVGSPACFWPSASSTGSSPMATAGARRRRRRTSRGRRMG